MFCSKCGNQLDDNAKFCDKCGTPTNGAAKVEEKVPDNECVLSVKPTFNILYFMFKPIVIIAIFLIFSLIGSFAGGGFSVFLSGLIISLIIFVICGIPMLFKIIQFKNMEYSFYKTKVIYRDSFLNQAEKEVKYKYIRECVLVRTLVDRIFGYGRVTLYTNAESGFANGIMIPYLKNSNEIYKQIKELLDD